MTYLTELFGQVMGSLLRNKLRSFLTIRRNWVRTL